MEGEAGNAIGAALRAARRERRLSLAQVAVRSGNEFKASALGAYERGDRAISVSRLQRLARVYGIGVDALLPADAPDIDLVRLERQQLSGLVLDVAMFRASDDEGAVAVMRFANVIRSARTLPTTSVIVVRRTDAALLATFLSCDPAELDQRLRPGAMVDAPR